MRERLGESLRVTSKKEHKVQRQASKPRPKKKQRGISPVFVLNSSVRIHAIMALWEACHEL
jgi:hypothetical protein